MAPTKTSSRAAAAAHLTTGLGCFSLALGTAQLAAPGAVNRAIGVRDDARSRRLQRFVGLQELSAAAGILTQRRPAGWLWARTGADVLHLTMLTRALADRAQDRRRLTGAIASVAGCFAADLSASMHAARTSPVPIR